MAALLDEVVLEAEDVVCILVGVETTMPVVALLEVVTAWLLVLAARLEVVGTVVLTKVVVGKTLVRAVVIVIMGLAEKVVGGRGPPPGGVGGGFHHGFGPDGLTQPCGTAQVPTLRQVPRRSCFICILVA